VCVCVRVFVFINEKFSSFPPFGPKKWQAPKKRDVKCR
jgi:hypothetical protein